MLCDLEIRECEIMPNIPSLRFDVLTPQRWDDIEKLFGERGACGGCWCMWWRLSRSQFNKQKGERNKEALRAIVDSGDAPGIIAYSGGEPAGWCAVAPREAFPTLERSRVLRRVDDQKVWSVVCFFIAKPFRHRGLTVELLKAAIEYVKDRGGRIVEGYPVEPKSGKTADAFAYTGLASTFLKAGFVEVARRSDTRPIMRHMIGNNG